MAEKNIADQFKGFDRPEIPLSDVVAYIALNKLNRRERGSLDMRRAALELVKAIQVGDLTALGTCKDKKSLQQIPRSAFLNAEPFGGDSNLRSFSTSPRLRWRDGEGRFVTGNNGGDIIEKRSSVGTRILWRNIFVRRDDVLTLWSFPQPSISGDNSAAKTIGDDAPDTLSSALAAEQSSPPRPNKPAAIAGWLKENYSDRPSLLAKEFMERVRHAAPHIGTFSERTFQKALRIAYPSGAHRK